MICVNFYRKNETVYGFSVSGHAGFADAGEDIVCAAVTSAIQLTANAITEILNVACDVNVFQEEISLRLPENSAENAYNFISALYLHLKTLSEDYPGTINVNFLEV